MVNGWILLLCKNIVLIPLVDIIGLHNTDDAFQRLLLFHSSPSLSCSLDNTGLAL